MQKFIKEFTVYYEDKTITSEVEVCFVYDSNYGADADGNKGIGMYFLEDIYPVEDITVDNEGNTLTEKEKQEVLNLLCSEAENYTWEVL